MIVNGTSNQDELYANKNDQVFGLDGDDILDASDGQGNNLLDGGSGNDRLFGNNNDTLKGGVGEDELFALDSSGFNTLEGGEDNDRLFVVEGSNNKLDGGTGNDRLIVSDGSGYNTLLGGTGNDLLDVSNGTGNNSLEGNEGDDVLIGGLGSDRLFGGIGDDSLFAGKKGSQLTGGTGEDRFFIASAAVPEVAVEVLDFTKGQDKVVITGIPEIQKFQDLKLEQTGLDTVIKASINGEFKEFGILRNVQANTLTPSDFYFKSSIFSITDASAVEGNAITFIITRTGDAQANQSVTVSTSLIGEDTASNTDFTTKTETLTFQAGQTQKSFTVVTTPDSLLEGNDTFTVSLSNPTNEAIINSTSGTAKGTITNDDSVPINSGVTITETGDSTNVTEGGITDSYSVVLASQPTADVIVTINSGKQIKTSSQTLTFTALNWNVVQNVTLTAIDDAIVEGDVYDGLRLRTDIIQHTFTSSDANYDGIAIASVNVSITDNDIPLAKSADNDIFTIKGKGEKTRLSVELTGHSSNQLYELGVFAVDDQQGNIQGIAPGTAGYTEAALQRGKAIFSSLNNVPNRFNGDLTSLLEFTSGEQLRFYLVRNSTTDNVLAGQTAITDVLFSDSTNLQIESLGDDSFSLAWKSQDLVVRIQATDQQLPLGTGLQGKRQGELIDLRGVIAQVKADFVVSREAAFNNFIGFYQVADENGGIDTNGDRTADILVGQAGYTEAAIRGRVPGIDLTVNNQGTATYTGTFGSDAIFAPFIIIDGRPDAISDRNVNNNPAVYFAFLGANSDKVDHIRLLGNNTFGFEDLANGGDKDFNDVVVQVNLTIA